MPIALPDDAREEAVATIQQYFQENMEEPLGTLAAGMLLDFFVEEIGPCIYNRAVVDVQERLQRRILEVDVELHQEAFGYWRRSDRRR